MPFSAVLKNMVSLYIDIPAYFKSFLTHHYQFVSIKKSIYRYGVLQGSLLGPLLLFFFFSVAHDSET